MQHPSDTFYYSPPRYGWTVHHMEDSWNTYLNSIRPYDTLSPDQYEYLLYWSQFHFDNVVCRPVERRIVLSSNVLYPSVQTHIDYAAMPYNLPFMSTDEEQSENFDHIQDFMQEISEETSFRRISNHITTDDRTGVQRNMQEAGIPTVPKKKLVIDTDIKTLRDLLDIVRDHPYSPDIESNLDLKALYNIRTELDEIDRMIGMASFKESLLDQLLYFMQGLHLNREQDFKHLVIYGPPGTGKSQVAKLIGLMYSKMGILKNGTFKKVTRNDLVAGFLGQTALKTQKVIQECLGGCLFIDEVYSLGSGYEGGSGGDGSGGGGDSYSKECIDTLCEALSDHKDDLMVIVAGYEADVKESFFKVNQGLPSRFIWRFTVDEYNADELRRIFLQKVEYNGWTMGPDQEWLIKWFTDKKSNFTHFGRDMELLFTYTKIGHGRRIYGKDEDLRRKLTMADMDRGYKQFLKNRDTTKDDRGKMPDSCFGLYV